MEKNNFDWAQQQEVDLGVAQGLDVSIYAKEEFVAAQMKEIRLGLEEHLDVSIYASVKYDWFQMAELRKGLMEHIDVAQYAAPAYNYKVMHEIRLALGVGLDISFYVKKGYRGEDLEQVRLAMIQGVNLDSYLEAGYQDEQLEEIRKAIVDGLDLNAWLNLVFFGKQIQEIRLGAAEGLPVAIYAREEYNWKQMYEIRLGLKQGLMVSVYANPLYTHIQMKEIRIGLEKKLNVESYASLAYTESEMKEKRLALEAKQKTNLSEAEKVNQEIAELSQTGGIKITITPDKMQAFVTLDKPAFGADYTVSQILKALEKQGITSGIQRGSIEALQKSKEYHTQKLVAQGLPVRHGEDGSFEFLFRQDMSFEPKFLPDGSIDYTDIEIFQQVKKGQKIAIYHPHHQGETGIDIFGMQIEPRPGKPCNLPKGKGFHLLEDGVTYVAAMNGKIEFKDGEVIISPLLLLTEDITAYTGKIIFEGSVQVNASVGSNGYIEAAEDIIIEGNVDMCTLIAGGNIMIKRGARVKEGCSIRAGKKVSGNFFEGAAIYAGEGVDANYLMNCQLETEGKVSIFGKKGVIIGGSTTAVGGLEAKNIGNSAGTETVITLGMNEKTLTKQRLLDTQLKERYSEIEVLMDGMKKYERLLQLKRPEAEDNCNKIRLALQIKQEQIKHILEEKRQLQEQMESNSNARLKVSGVAYAGCMITINLTRYYLKAEVKRVNFQKKDGRIVLTKYY